jgi:hypothetical protein
MFFRIFLIVALSSCLFLAACQTEEPDSFATPSEAANVVISGSVGAAFSVVNGDLSPEVFSMFGEEIIVMALEDPTDLRSAVASTVLPTVGSFELAFETLADEVWIVAVADDGDGILTSQESRWEFHGNPVPAASVAGLDLRVEVPVIGVGETNPDANWWTLQGEVTGEQTLYLSVGQRWRGMVASATVGPGEFELEVEADLDSSVAIVVGFDEDGDGLVALNDPAEETVSFTAPAFGSVIDIGSISAPLDALQPVDQPGTWVEVSGSISGDRPVNVPVVVEARRFTSHGRLWASTTLEPGTVDFTLRVPVSATVGETYRPQEREIWFQAFLDTDQDSELDVHDESHGGVGPIDIGEDGLTNLFLDIKENPTPLWGSVEGIIDWNGAVADDDQLLVALFRPDELWLGLCEYVDIFAGPEFGYEYSFPAVPPGFYIVGSSLAQPDRLTVPEWAIADGDSGSIIELRAGEVVRADIQLRSTSSGTTVSSY